MNAADLLIEGAVERLLSCHTQQMCEILQEGDIDSNTTASAGLLKHCKWVRKFTQSMQIKSYNNVHPLLKSAGILPLARNQAAVREELSPFATGFALTMQ